MATLSSMSTETTTMQAPVATMPSMTYPLPVVRNRHAGTDAGINEVTEYQRQPVNQYSVPGPSYQVPGPTYTQPAQMSYAPQMSYAAPMMSSMPTYGNYGGYPSTGYGYTTTKAADLA